jgi:hypothetical protein
MPVREPLRPLVRDEEEAPRNSDRAYQGFCVPSSTEGSWSAKSSTTGIANSSHVARTRRVRHLANIGSATIDRTNSDPMNHRWAGVQLPVYPERSPSTVQ